MSIELFIAACALLFTFYQAWLARHHNRLSVRPHLQWSIAERWMMGGLRYQLDIQNCGLGPARITKIEAFSGNQHFDVTSAASIQEVIETTYNDVVPVAINTINFPGRNYVMKAQTEYTLLVMEFPGLQPQQADELKFTRPAIKISYESFYGEKSTLDSRL